MIDLLKIANQFNLKIIGESDKTVSEVTELSNQCIGGITWVKSKDYIHLISKGIILINDKINFEPKDNTTYLITNENTKLIFSKIIQAYFTPNIDYYLVDKSKKHKANLDLKIAPNVFIGQNVTIGKGTVIHPFVTIEANTVIGENCVIKTQTSIGTEGLGLILDKETDSLIKFPQIGNVILENSVEIGPNSTVRRGALKETRIKEGAKIGALINIGHNCTIGRNTILTCNIVTGGSSTIGDYSFIGVNAMIKNGVSVGKNTQIGMGSNVTKSIPDNVVAYGNPAKIIRSND